MLRGSRKQPKTGTGVRFDSSRSAAHGGGKHVLFYRESLGGILVVRILHERMLPERNAMDDDSAGEP